jgi:hypothetical protein
VEVPRQFRCGVSLHKEKSMSKPFMRCKFQIHSAMKLPIHSSGSLKKMADGSYVTEKSCVQVKMGAVWHGSNADQVKSENAIFGDATPHGEFTATIHNEALFERLLGMVGQQVYLDFTLADLQPAPSEQAG